MDVREKLVELLDKANSACVGTDCFEGCKFYMENDCLYKLMADVMIENGVTVQGVGGCCRCKGTSEMMVAISNKLVAGVRTGWLGGNLPARYCPFCGRKLPQPPKGE